eukprot:ctg_6882.g779
MYWGDNAAEECSVLVRRGELLHGVLDRAHVAPPSSVWCM